MGHPTVKFPKLSPGEKIILHGNPYTLDHDKSAVILDSDVGLALALGGQSQHDSASPPTMRVLGHPSYTEVNIAGRLYEVRDGVIEDLNPEHYPAAYELGFREAPDPDFPPAA